MAGTVTTTELVWKSVKKITFDWLSSGSSSGMQLGTATATTTKYYDGGVLRIVCLENTSTGYAIEINDNDGVDLLGGQGAAMTSGGADFGTSTGVSMTGPGLSTVNSKISLNVTDSCGGGSTGVAIVYIR